MGQHPGGKALISSKIGQDASTSFNGGVYDHSTAAHNVRLFPDMEQDSLTAVIVRFSQWCVSVYSKAESRSFRKMTMFSPQQRLLTTVSLLFDNPINIQCYAIDAMISNQTSLQDTTHSWVEWPSLDVVHICFCLVITKRNSMNQFILTTAKYHIVFLWLMSCFEMKFHLGMNQRMSRTATRKALYDISCQLHWTLDHWDDDLQWLCWIEFAICLPCLWPSEVLWTVVSPM